MGHSQRAMIAFSIGMLVMSALAFFAFKACGGMSETPQIDPSKLATRYPGALRQASDASAEAGARTILTAIETYRGNTGALPSPADVSPSGALAEYVPEWPTNPFTKQPMNQGGELGDLRYALTPDGDYTLVVLLTEGELQLH